MNKVIEAQERQDYVGWQCEPTDWVQIDQDTVNQFADVTRDHQFVHVDVEQAKETVYGGTIAHGFLTLSMLGYFTSQFLLTFANKKMGLNYGFDKIRFLAPVKTGKRIRAKATVLNVSDDKPGKILVRYNLEIEIEDEETPALIAEWLHMTILE